MAYDAVAEARNLLTLLQTLCGGRAFLEVVDEQKLEYFDANRTKVKPYTVLHIGEPFDLADERTIVEEEQQPMVLPFQVACWASDPDSALATAGDVRPTIRGKRVTENASPIRLGGGGQFSKGNNAVSPSLYMRLITGEMLINMLVDTDAP